MICSNCNYSCRNNDEYCPNCGNKLNNQYNFNIPKEYTPISALGYFGYQILFSIPILGFIFLLIFALGGTENINLRNFSRSYFCFIFIFLFLLFIFGASIAGLVAIFNR